MPAVVVAALTMGLATPAAADVAPRREHKTRTLEPQHAPEMTPPSEQPEQPAQPEAAPPSQPTTPSTEAAPEAAPPQSPSKAEPPKAEAKSATEEKTSSCSIDDDGSEQDLAGLAALVLLLCGASLRRRRV